MGQDKIVAACCQHERTAGKSDPACVEALVDELQQAYQAASGGSPSNQDHIRVRWRKVACHILSGTRETADDRHLAVELHLVFIGEGHRTEIVNRAEDDPVLKGWRGVAKRVIAGCQQATPV